MRKKGVMEKCTFCVQRTRKGKNPACVEACPTGARIFGNLLDPKSTIRWVLENKKVFYFFTLALMVLVYVFLRRLLWSPFGRALAGIRVNEHRMRALGYGTFNHKLAAFTLAGALAGLAGFLWGAQSGYVNPELMGFHMSAHVIMMVILGGMGNFAGAIVGAFSFEYLLHVFKDLPQVAGFNLGKHWQLWMDKFIVALIVLAPRGILGLFASMLKDKSEKQGPQP